LGDNPPMLTRFLLLCGLLVPLTAVANGIDQFRAFLQATKQARGSFTQTVTAKSGRKPQQSAGTFAFLRPGKFRWSYDKPYKQLLVCDGQKLWSYDPDLRQVTVRKLGQALGSSPAALLAGDALENNFVLVDGGTANELEFVEAMPNSKEGTFESVRIGMKDNLPRIMEVRDNFGQTTTLLLDKFEVNAALPADTFRFTPPKGADVVGE
jgi:outer membrane lipoprotein carrier protein